MIKIAEQLAFYQSYHRSAGCRATHFFGVPLVTLSILIPMGWLSTPLAGIRITFAMLFVLSTLAYYIRLEKTLAMMMALVILPVLFIAEWISRFPFRDSFLVFTTTFILGWGLQLLGHALEGKRPALMDNFFPSVFTAPLFLVAEVLFSLGWGSELQLKIAAIEKSSIRIRRSISVDFRERQLQNKD
jgi:uncharacterized membrane protein YGL010W